MGAEQTARGGFRFSEWSETLGGIQILLLILRIFAPIHWGLVLVPVWVTMLVILLAAVSAVIREYRETSMRGGGDE